VILCVDPDEDARETTRAALADAGFGARACGSAAEAVSALDEGPVDCLVTEYDLGEATGLELVERVRERSPDTACVLFTDTPLDDVDTAAFGGVIAEYLRKDVPDAREELVGVVEHSLSFLSQTSYPLPDDEGARLAALERYTTEPAALSGALDRLTELAAALFGVDQSFVGLVDAHHERFVSCHGVELDVAPREDTVCTYAILDEDVTVVEDTREDPRFGDNDAIEAAGVRFYAGAPVVTDDGQAIGSFCLMDDEPRSFDAEEARLLAMFAEEAMDQLDLHRRLDETVEAEA
jgi:CheY-like chemotaxis protein